MIKSILIFNNHGKPRLIRFYQYFAEEMQQQIIRETFHLVSKRDDNVCNFLEGGSLIGGSDDKLIYRHYATLYFVFCVDSSESELGILDLIQVFVETLDKCFENVCELDLIFHMDKVHYILQEVVMGGMVLETNMNEIVAQVELQNRMEKSEVSPSATLKDHASVLTSNITVFISLVADLRIAAHISDVASDPNRSDVAVDVVETTDQSELSRPSS
ncbi:AP-3 complex subunit sigma-2 isoform X1 [Anarhichas minor]|uniref:AP-3 complex subunit sigma-2 isoform X1 n=1 Tax=Anarhichas minor TaxID=65739 RepID=UPI003F74184E